MGFAKGKRKELVMANPNSGEDAVKLQRLQKEYQELKHENSMQKDAIALLKQQCHEQSMRHAQLHRELEGVLRLFIQAQMDAKKRGATSETEREQYSQRGVLPLYKDRNAIMPPFDLEKMQQQPA